jgi:hypothetical protein
MSPGIPTGLNPGPMLPMGLDKRPGTIGALELLALTAVFAIDPVSGLIGQTFVGFTTA